MSENKNNIIKAEYKTSATFKIPKGIDLEDRSQVMDWYIDCYRLIINLHKWKGEYKVRLIITPTDVIETDEPCKTEQEFSEEHSKAKCSFRKEKWN